MNCRICSSNNLIEIEAREMMFGTREPFVYQKCLDCGSLQIKRIPEDLGRYYPDNYYSYNDHKANDSGGIVNRLKKTYTYLYFRQKEGSLFHNVLQRMYNPRFLKQFKFPGISFDSKILDVGCGNGAKLQYLYRHGFKNLEGIDPFIENDITYKNGIKVFKRTVHQHTGKYDLIYLNHVFEHMENPAETLLRLSELLKDRGILIISMPVADCFAEKEYGINWIAMDPPRHLHIFSEKGMKEFSSKAGFEVKHVSYNSTEKQFTGSELLKQGIPLISEDRKPDSALFTKSKIKEYRKKSELLNMRSEGDAASYYLKKLN